jgi:hypothetical protein
MTDRTLLQQAVEAPALKRVLDALRLGRVACEWAGHHDEAATFGAAMEDARALAAIQQQPEPVAQPLTDAQADAIHSMPWVRDCLLRYADRPCDKEARDAVRAITNAANGLMVGAAPPTLQQEEEPREAKHEDVTAYIRLYEDGVVASLFTGPAAYKLKEGCYPLVLASPSPKEQKPEGGKEAVATDRARELMALIDLYRHQLVSRPLNTDETGVTYKQIDTGIRALAFGVPVVAAASPQQEGKGEAVMPHTPLLERALSAMAEVQEQAEPGFAPGVAIIPAADWRMFVDEHAELSMLWTAWRDSPGWPCVCGPICQDEGAPTCRYTAPSPSTAVQQEAGSADVLMRLTAAMTRNGDSHKYHDLICEADRAVVRASAAAPTQQPPSDQPNLSQMWKDAYAAFKGAFDTPQMRRTQSDEYSADARKRLRDFDELFSGACVQPPSVSDGGKECATCGGIGMVSTVEYADSMHGFLSGMPCPDCTPTATQPPSCGGEGGKGEK